MDNVFTAAGLFAAIRRFPEDFAVFGVFMAAGAALMIYWLVVEHPAVRAFWRRWETTHRRAAPPAAQSLHPPAGRLLTGHRPTGHPLTAHPLTGHPLTGHRPAGELNFGLFVFNKLWGVLWLGVFCTVVARLLWPESSMADLGMRFPPSPATLTSSIIWIAALLPPALGATWRKSVKIRRNGGDFGRYPELGAGEWRAGAHLVHVAGWTAYLVAYELLFRGVLLLPVAATIGAWPAIGINSALYAVVHIAKGPAEAVGALVLGLVLCIATLLTGSIVIAVVVHTAVALTNGWLAAAWSNRRPAVATEAAPGA